jgi:superfamily II DNA or RNA helicase
MNKRVTKLYESVIKQSKISDRPYQKDFLTNPIYSKPNKPLVLGAGTSSGKTVIAILKLIMFYLSSSNKKKQCLVIPAFQEILRDNFMEQLKEIETNYGKLPFTYVEIKGRNNEQQIRLAINKGINVIICLPNTVNNHSSLFKNKIEWLYFDEAQYYYLQTMCKNLIKVIKPKYQMLMTGSVAKYNARKNDFIIKYVPVAELYKLGYVSSPKVELVQSSYNFKDADYLSIWGNLKSGNTNSNSENTKALLSVAKGMLLTIKRPFMDVTTNTKPIKKMLRVFGEIDKTIMICNSIAQAECFYEILNKELKNNVMISHSETDKEDWDNFEKFKKNDTKLLIVVNQGRIGFSMRELFNIVDFSMTKDFEMIQQIFGRLLRTSVLQPNKQKIYYKVSTTDLAKWYEYTMRCVMCLMHMDWYSTYEGDKKQFKFPKRIANALNNTIKTNNKKSSKSKSNGFKISDEFPLDLNYVNYVNQNMKSNFATYAWWDLKDVMKEEFGMKRWYSVNEVKLELQKYSTYKQAELNASWAITWAQRYDISLLNHLKKSFNLVNENEAKKVFKNWKGTKKEFREKYEKYMHWAQRNGYYDKWTKHFKSGRWEGKYTDLNQIKKIIKVNNINSAQELKAYDRAMHAGISRNGLINKIW